MDDHSYTRNVKFAAYLRLMGHHPDKIQKLSRGKASYGYLKEKVSEIEWEHLKGAFDRSDFIKYAQNLDAITDLAY